MPVIQAESFPNGERPAAKGRNGYFDIEQIVVESFRLYQHAEIMLQFMAKRSAYPGPAYARITAGMARKVGQALIAEADAAEKGVPSCP